MADNDLGLIQLCKVLDGPVNGGGGNWRVGVTWKCWGGGVGGGDEGLCGGVGCGHMEVLGCRSPGMSWRVCGVVCSVVAWRCWAGEVGG